MRILVDMTHPADFHMFRPAIEAWGERGHETIIAARDKDITRDLIAARGWDALPIGTQGRGTVGLAREMLDRQRKLWRVIRRTRPDVVTSMSGAYVGPPAWLRGVPCVAWTDTEHAALQNRIGFAVSRAVVTPACYTGHVPPAKHLTYRGYHELAYLHPDRFTPDSEVLERFGLEPGEPFGFIRLVSWQAQHDVGQSGLADLQRIVQALERHGQVRISSERPLPPELDRYVVKDHANLIHHLLAFAQLVVGESGTMISEAAVLGTPGVFANTCRLGYIAEQEDRYGLVRAYHDPDTMLDHTLAAIEALLLDPQTPERCEAARRRLLDDCQDVTAVIADTVEAYGRGATLPAGGLTFGERDAGNR